MARAVKNADNVDTSLTQKEENTMSENTSLAPATNTGLALNKALAARLPEQYQDAVLMLERPSTAALVELVSKLDESWQGKVTSLLRRMRPTKQGIHTKGGGFKITEVKLYQGVGNDPARPAKLPPGGLYTSDTQTLETPFIGAVIGLHETRTMWPPLEGARSGPLCYSLDMVQGSKYGKCEACPNSKKLPRDGGCGTEVVAYVVDKDMTGVYSIKFSKTSFRAGRQLIQLVSAGDEIWSRWVSFSEQEYKDGSKRWFGLKASAVESKNQADLFVPRELDPVLRALSQALDAEVYYPALADVYDRSRAGTSTVTLNVAGETFDEPLADNGLPDYSNA